MGDVISWFQTGTRHILQMLPKLSFLAALTLEFTCSVCHSYKIEEGYMTYIIGYVSDK
jgi:hypothetical protein